MTVKITLTLEIESRLKGEASRNGLDVDAYATKLIADHFPAEDLASASEVDTPPLRDMSPIYSKRPSIFTQQMNVRVDDLPKWKPQVVVTRRAGVVIPNHQEPEICESWPFELFGFEF